MKKNFLFVLLLVSFLCSAQKESILDYDPCSIEIDNSLKKQFTKAFSYFQDRKYQKASSFLNSIIKEESNFASPYFIMGMIGVNTDNTKMIEKYFPLCRENCEEFSHPLLWYYLGVIDYSDEKYLQAQKDFQTFMELTEDIESYDSLRNQAINYLNWSDFLSETMENPVEYSPQRLNFLAENMNYYEPFISYDEKEVYFLREEITRDTVRDSFLSSFEVKKEILTGKSLLDEKGFYDRGFKEDLPFNNGKREGRVSITPDNNRLYLSVKNEETDNRTWDIYYCDKYEGYWSEAKRLNISTDAYDELQPSISEDGNTLYFVSNRVGGKGGYDIWVSQREDKDLWKEPINMGANINTPYDELMPFIAADDTKFYFVSNGWRTIGGFDIFYTDINSEQKPKNIGYPINTEQSEQGLGVYADGKTAYIVKQNDKTKKSEIYTFSLPEKARAEKKVLKNAYTDMEVSANITISLLDVEKQTIKNMIVLSQNNNFALMLSEKKNYILLFNSLGYMFYSRVVNTENEDSLSVKVSPIEAGQRMQLEDIQLNKQKTDFTYESSIILDNFIIFLKNNPRIRINLQAKKDMLEKIYTYLTRNGIREDRINKEYSQSEKVFYQIN